MMTLTLTLSDSPCNPQHVDSLYSLFKTNKRVADKFIIATFPSFVEQDEFLLTLKIFDHFKDESALIIEEAKRMLQQMRLCHEKHPSKEQITRQRVRQSLIDREMEQTVAKEWKMINPSPKNGK